MGTHMPHGITQLPASRRNLAVYFGTEQRAVMPSGWEGSSGSDFALTVRHILQWFIQLYSLME